MSNSEYIVFLIEQMKNFIYEYPNLNDYISAVINLNNDLNPDIQTIKKMIKEP